ncbi:MAG: hypothetical protein JSS74_11665 [Actinobacteria bacterium]|nr:hypothetical protein [Actinomycetota bacterium]
MPILPSISGPRDLDALSPAQLTKLAAEIRAFLIENVARTGGHLGPNLGVVELTIALHRVFRSPEDPFIFDTGHQSYVHKLLTGRQDFSALRSRGGLAGYPQRSESAHDVVESSHASSSLSWADGISRAFTATGRADRHVVAVVGDGALTGGMTWEALNNISDDNERNLVIVVNDNGRSYAPTIGGMARYMNRVRTAAVYRDLHRKSDRLFRAFGSVGRAFYRGVRGGTHGFLSRFSDNEELYSNLDIKYLGPVDGHDIGALTETVLNRPLAPLEHTAIDTALAGAVRDAEVPILPMVVERLLRPDPADDSDGRLAEDGRLAGHALRRLVLGDLSGLFDGPSTVKFDPSLPMVSLDLSRVTENSTLISVLMTCSSAWMEAALLDPNGGRRWVIYDEAWRLMSHPALLRRMDAHWRLARHYGLANLLVFHKLTDLENVGDMGSANRALANSLLANAETRIVYRQETDQLGPTAAALGLTGTEQRLLPGLGTGQGLWRIKDRSFVVQHQLHPAELAAFDTTARMTGGEPAHARTSMN